MEKKRALLWLLLLAMATIPAMLGRVLKNPDAQIFSDSEGYFWYLPAVFSKTPVLEYPARNFLFTQTADGDTLNKYTCGVAYFELPGYLIVSLLYGEWERSERTLAAYSIALGITGVLVAFVGLLLLFNFLTRFFRPVISLLTVLLVFLGTNLFHYTTFEMGMSHVYSFTLFSSLLWLSPKLYAQPSAKKALLAGAIVGWITLIRPTNLIVLLPLVLYDVYNLQDFQRRVQFYRKHLGKLLLAMLAGSLLVFPQLIYWKAATGNWIAYSYAGEGFIYWARPKILAVLFDTQNGLFIYSPVVLFMFAGILWTTIKGKHQGWINLLLFAMATYTFASWWAWWYGGAFGHRCYVEYFAFFALPLAYVLDQIGRIKRKAIKASFYLLLLMMTYYSVGMSYLYRTCYAPWDGPEWTWNYERLAELIKQLYPIF